MRACPTNAIEVRKGWTPEDATRGADSPAPEGRLSTRPIHVSFESCIGCGACENACNDVVYGVSAMITTSYGRATPSRIPAKDEGKDL